MKLALSLMLFLFVLTLGTAQSFLFEAVLLTTASVVISLFLLPKSTEKSKFSFRFIGYAAWLFKEIFLSSVAMIKIILQPKRLQLVPVIGGIKTKQQDNIYKTVLAHSITLTPGTITISLDENMVSVHAISKEHLKDLKKSPMGQLLGACSKPL